MMQNRICSFLFLFFTSLVSFGQGTLKFEKEGGPAAKGPSATDQVVNLSYGDGAVYAPKTTVTFKLSNQQFSAIEGNTRVPGLTFGATINDGGNAIPGAPIYPALNYIGNARNTDYATGGAKPGIDVATDYGINLFPTSDALISSDSRSAYPINRDVYYGDLTISFSRPVTNPILHFAGMGGWFGYTVSSNDIYYVLGYSGQFELTNTGYTLSRLSGSTYFAVDNNKTIRNSATRIGDDTRGGTVDIKDQSTGYSTTVRNVTRYAASGSVKVNGDNITTLTFKVYLHPDGGMITNSNGTVVSGAGGRTPRCSSGSNDPDGLNPMVNGDNLLLSTSLTTYSISGNVFNDANGLTDNTVNGTGTNAGGLNAVLIDAGTNTVVAVVPVNADGTYQFNNAALPGDYAIAITTATATPGNTPPAVILPKGWVATGEHLGTDAGNDGLPDGILTGITLSNTNLTQANFGIERTPVAENVEQTIPIPLKNIIPIGSLSTPVRGSDPEDGTMGNGNTLVITKLPTNSTLFYNNKAVTAGQVIPDFNPLLLSFTDLQGGAMLTSFEYTFVDAANQKGVPATYTVKWDSALPVTFKTVDAYFDNGQLVVNWSTVMEKDNDHFEVELSRDGTTFTAIGTLSSKAPGGNSDNELSYSFTKAAGSAASLAGLGIFALGMALSVFPGKKKLWAGLSSMVMIVLFTVSCSKKEAITTEQTGPFFVRIAQINKDGTKEVSKIVQVTER